MKKIASLILSAVLLLTATGCGATTSSTSENSAETTANTDVTTETVTSAGETQGDVQDLTDKIDIKIASLKGPTTIGMVKLMSDSAAEKTTNNYNVDIYATADEIVTKIVKGEIDIANVPCNLASVLYKKTEGAISVAAINTLGVLYVVESGDTIKTVADLKGKTIYSTGKGTTPEYILNYILKSNGIDTEKDVNIEYKSEATEVAAVMADDKNAIGVLPQPYVTVAQTKNADLKVALDLTSEWDKVSTDSSCVTGVVIVRNEFLEANKDAFDSFLADFKSSTEYVNANVDEAAKLVGEYDIVAEPVAKKAIPLCNIKYIDGSEMKTKISGYLSVLFDADPTSVGGTLPDDAFYYQG